VTGKARAAIRRATRDAVHTQYATLGREILKREIERAGGAFDDKAVSRCVEHSGYGDDDGFLAAVGRGELSAADTVQIALPNASADRKRVNNSSSNRRWFSIGQAMWPRPRKRSGKQSGSGEAIPIRGLNTDLPVQIASETGAVPGERIVGILSPGEGVTIYPIDSRALKAFEDEPDRWIDLAWDVDQDSDDRFPARIAVSVVNEVGTLAQIAAVIGENDGNIANLTMVNRAPDFFEMHIDVEVSDLKHLNDIISKLRRKSVVSKVQRLNGA